MARSKKHIHPNNETLAELVKTHGIEAVVEATAYKVSTIMLYSQGHCGVIPTPRLKNAIKLLEQK